MRAVPRPKRSAGLTLLGNLVTAGHNSPVVDQALKKMSYFIRGFVCAGNVGIKTPGSGEKCHVFTG